MRPTTVTKPTASFFITLPPAVFEDFITQLYGVSVAVTPLSIEKCLGQASDGDVFPADRFAPARAPGRRAWLAGRDIARCDSGVGAGYRLAVVTIEHSLTARAFAARPE